MELSEYKKMYDIEDSHWWFNAKRQYINIVLKKFFKNKSGLKILDVGCGTGAVIEYLRLKNQQAIGVDASDIAIDYCRQKNLPVEKSEAHKTKFSGETFDVVLALDLLEHLENPEEAIKEMKRILKQGGLLIATVPAHQFLWSYHDVSLYHKKRYNKESLASLFKGEFFIELISWIHALILPPVIIIRLKNKLIGSNGGSDVRQSGKITNLVMKFLYIFELGFFNIFKYLPFGLSLIIVARKENNGNDFKNQ